MQKSSELYSTLITNIPQLPDITNSVTKVGSYSTGALPFLVTKVQTQKGNTLHVYRRWLWSQHDLSCII